MTGVVRVGTAGWVYEPWRGTFYPRGLVQKNELAHASRQLTTIEINATFRMNQKPASFEKWASETPESFVFSVKANQKITHVRRLRDCEADLAEFFASGPLALGSRLGPFVWQLPPTLRYDTASIEAFLALLPRTARDYVQLAGQAASGNTAPYLDQTSVESIRHAIEPRHPSFDTAEFRTLLSKYNVALVLTDTADNPSRELTADFAYLRLQGPARPSAMGYEHQDIAAWAGTIEQWRQRGVDVFAYFVHEDKLHAPANAVALQMALGITAASN